MFKSFQVKYLLLGLIYLLVLAMPFGIRFLPYLLSTTFLVWFIVVITGKFYALKDFRNTTLYLLPVLAIISLVSLLYTSNVSNGLKMLERLISFVLLPFVFLIAKKELKINIHVVFTLLGISLLVAIAHLFISVYEKVGIEKFREFSSFHDIIEYFRYYSIIKGFTIHPSYLSYILLIYLLYFFFQSKTKKALYVLHVPIAISALLTLATLQSRAAILCLLFLILYGTLVQVYKKRWLSLSLLLLILVSSSYGIYKYSRLGETLKETAVLNEETKKIDPRLVIWKNSIETIKNAPLMGYGIGDALDELIKEHEKTEFKAGVFYSFDAHNHFLETWLQSGIFGLISLLLVFAIPLYQSIKKKQELLFLFLMISFIQLQFESMFVRLAGVVYFAFFYCYFYYVYYAEGGEWERTRQKTNSGYDTKLNAADNNPETISQKP
ncbi:MAG: O-antigen ligase family protein [Bacteroidota bacterium]|nr:MAG: O-antigen ligase family protein [Bacteroidota bacterium]